MATKKEQKIVFQKPQIVHFKRYAEYRDLLTVILENGKDYTHEQIEKEIEKFKKGQVK